MILSKLHKQATSTVRCETAFTLNATQGGAHTVYCGSRRKPIKDMPFTGIACVNYVIRVRGFDCHSKGEPIS